LPGKMLLLMLSFLHNDGVGSGGSVLIALGRCAIVPHLYVG